MNDYTLKRCSKCKEDKPATLEFFCCRNSNPDGLNGECKQCVKTRADQNRDKSKTYHQEWYIRNKERLNQRNREYWHENRERLNDWQRAYREEHHDERVAKQRIYIHRNREEIARKGKIYYRKNPHVAKAGYHRYRARKLSLPNDWTPQDWMRCLEFWHYCCAVCGNQLRDLFGDVKPHADHWHPLNLPGCPGTVPGNMICLCSSCNCSKHDRLPDVWLTDYFGKRKAALILKPILAYFALVKRE